MAPAFRCLVDPAGARLLHDKAASEDKTLKIYPDAFHEVFNDPGHEIVLGDIEAEQGNTEKAMEHYAVVANSGGEIGEAATHKLQRLKLPSSPGEVIPRRCDADSSGNLVVSVKNTTPWAIEGVQIAVTYTDAAGRAQVVRQTIPNRIPPGEIASFNTGLGPYSGDSCPAEVTAARYAE